MFVAAGSGSGGRARSLLTVPAHLPRSSAGAGAGPGQRLHVSQFISNIFTIFTDNKSTVHNNGQHSLYLTNVFKKETLKLILLNV